MTRLLVMGDNHGDAESLRRVREDVAGESFDLAIHVGDFTRAWRHDRDLAVEQLRETEPLLAELDAVADDGLAWVWGNQDYFGDLDYELDVGTEIPADGHVELAGRRFTSDPDRVEADSVLVTHMETWSLVDHFEGLAHFCGNTHLGRWLDDRLNAAFLQVTDPETGERTDGGYFVVDLDDDGIADVDLRSIGDLHRRTCDVHRERGVGFHTSERDCTYCWDERALYRELAASAFYGESGGDEDATVPAADLVAHAVGLWDDPPAGFRDSFAEYLDDVEGDRYAPLARVDGGLTVAEESYAY